jgi:hypothetical protein
MTPELDTDAFTEELLERLAQHDPKSFPDEDDGQDETSWDRHERERGFDRRNAGVSEKESDNTDRHNTVFRAWQNQAVKEGRRRAYAPPKPEAMGKDTLREEIESQIEWKNSPAKDRRDQWMLHHEMGQNAKAAKDLGLPEAKTFAEKVQLQQLIQGQNQQPQLTPTQAAAGPEIMAKVDATIDAIIPYVQAAAQGGTDLPTQLQQWHAAEQYLQAQPVEGLKWLANHYGVSLAALSDPEMAHYDRMARNSGTRLPEAIGRYVAAEQFLEHDPVAGIKWLMKNYRVSIDQLTKAKRRAA